MNAIHLSDQSINALDPTTVVVTVLSGWPKVMVSRSLDDILKDYSQVFQNGTNRDALDWALFAIGPSQYQVVSFSNGCVSLLLLD